MTADPLQFITELTQSVGAVVSPAICYYGHAPQEIRLPHVIVDVDFNHIDPEMDHDEAHVAARVTFDCRAYGSALEAADLCRMVYSHFRHFTGELVTGGNARIELAEREGLANAPSFEGDQTYWLEILSYLFIYRED